MKKINSRKKAFTLAEVLITLSIIGVVAALTIPTLIQRTGNEEYVSRLMKAYSTLSQATESIITEYGSPKVWNTDVDALYNAYKSYLRNAKDCSSAAGCFSQGAFKLLNGVIERNDWNAAIIYRKLILSDGVQVGFRHDSIDCTGGRNNLDCATFLVDVNGQKAPNQYGRDVFNFKLRENGLYPSGCDNTEDNYCNLDDAEGNGGTGYGCTARVIAEGAMNY